MAGVLAHFRAWAKAIKRDALALYLAARDPRVPWYAKAVAAGVAAYALSPIDLIPDFVPVLGYLDEFVVLPLGILLAVRLVPAGVMAELRAEAEVRWREGKPVSSTAAAVIVVVWVVAAVAVGAWLAAFFRS
jgi:uncharacterized membrane protein YkvA (DUF1232 family)